MSRGTKLTDYEKGQITSLNALNWSNRRIALEIGRSKHVVNNYLSNPDAYGRKNPGGRPSSLTKHEKNRIL